MIPTQIRADQHVGDSGRFTRVLSRKNHVFSSNISTKMDFGVTVYAKPDRDDIFDRLIDQPLVVRKLENHSATIDLVSQRHDPEPPGQLGAHPLEVIGSQIIYTSITAKVRDQALAGFVVIPKRPL